MGHNRLKWNISIEQGNEIAHSIIKDILSQNNNPVPIDELIFLINNPSIEKITSESLGFSSSQVK